jgi:hypothetical protein
VELRLMSGYDLVVRDARIQGRDALSDIAVHDGEIAAIGEVESTEERELDAAGWLAFPGFVDCHVHMDKAFATLGADVPRYNDVPFSFERVVAAAEEYFDETSTAALTRRAASNAIWALERGTLWIRSHATVGTGHGTAGVEAVVRAKELLRDLVDVEVVAYSETDVLSETTRKELERSVELGADLIGGMDPATTDSDVAAGVDRLFELASRLDVGVDSHIHEPGVTGLETLEEIVDATRAYGYQGRTAVSHGYALAEADGCPVRTRHGQPARLRLLPRRRGHTGCPVDARASPSRYARTRRLPLLRVEPRGEPAVGTRDGRRYVRSGPRFVRSRTGCTGERRLRRRADLRVGHPRRCGREVRGLEGSVVEDGTLVRSVRDELEKRLGAPLVPRSPLHY